MRGLRESVNEACLLSGERRAVFDESVEGQVPGTSAAPPQQPDVSDSCCLRMWCFIVRG